MITKLQELKIREYLTKQFGFANYMFDHESLAILVRVNDAWQPYGHADSLEVLQKACGKPARAGEEFTADEDDRIARMHAEGFSAAVIAEDLGRHPIGISYRITKLQMYAITGR